MKETGRIGMNFENLPVDQQRAIIALIESPSMKDAAKSCKISVTKMWGLLKKESFIRALDEERNRIFREALANIQAYTTKAVNVLASLMDSDDEKVRRGAANDILDKAFKAREAIEVEVKIKEMEAKLCDLIRD